MIFFSFGEINCCGSASLKLRICNAASPWSQSPSPDSQCLGELNPCEGGLISLPLLLFERNVIMPITPKAGCAKGSRNAEE